MSAPSSQGAFMGLRNREPRDEPDLQFPAPNCPPTVKSSPAPKKRALKRSLKKANTGTSTLPESSAVRIDFRPKIVPRLRLRVNFKETVEFNEGEPEPTKPPASDPSQTSSDNQTSDTSNDSSASDSSEVETGTSQSTERASGKNGASSDSGDNSDDSDSAGSPQYEIKFSTPASRQVIVISDSDSDSSSESDPEDEIRAYRLEQMARTGPPQTLKIKAPKQPGPSQDTAQASDVPERTTSLKLSIKPPTAPQQGKQSTPAHSSQQENKKGKKRATGVDGQNTSAKKVNKAAQHDDSEDELSQRPGPIRRLTLTTKSLAEPAQSPIAPTPTLKIKHKGKVPKRALGQGYDSELEDREADPTIIDSVIVRFPEGPDLDYLNEALASHTIGVSRAQGGADIQFRVLDRAARRAVVIVRGQRWAASMVDLPCIVEALKSWDKKSFVKSADISQMLLVLGKVQTDEEAKIYPFPDDVDPVTYQYAHGITPPMHNVRQRRYDRTNRASKARIEEAERKADEMIALDAKALSVKVSFIDWDSDDDSDDEGQEIVEELDEDGNVIEDEFADEDFDDDAAGDEVLDDGFVTPALPPGSQRVLNGIPVEGDDGKAENEDEDDNEDFIMQAFNEEEDQTAMASDAVTTPAGAGTSGADDESESEGAKSMDEEDREAAAQKQNALNEIDELKEELTKQNALFAVQNNLILKRKVAARIEQINGDLETARKTAGLDADGDDADEDV